MSTLKLINSLLLRPKNIYTMVMFIASGFLFLLLFSSPAIFTFLFLHFALGTAICFYLSSNRLSEVISILKIFIYSSLLYFSYSAILFSSFDSQVGFEKFIDQSYFHAISDSLKNKLSLLEVFKETIINRKHVENEGAHFFFGSIAYIANKYFNESFVQLQSLSVAAFAVFVNVFLYKTLRFYVSRKNSFLFTILFASLSFTFSYSPWILRDIQILFFFSVSFYLVHKNFQVKVFVLLLLVQAVVMQFRLESGIALSFLTVLYVHIQAKEYKYKQLLYLACILMLSLGFYYFSDLVINNFLTVQNTLTRYSTFTSNAVEDQSGLGGALYKLPFGIKQLAVSIFSQVSPFPPWGAIQEESSFLIKMSSLMIGVSGSFWSYVIFISVTFFIHDYKKTPKILLYSILFFCLFILANSANPGIRRIMAVYPIAYTYFSYAAVNMTRATLFRRTMLFISLYLALIFVYIIAKYF